MVFLIHTALSNVKSLAVVISLITTIKKMGSISITNGFPKDTTIYVYIVAKYNISMHKL